MIQNYRYEKDYHRRPNSNSCEYARPINPWLQTGILLAKTAGGNSSAANAKY